MNTLIKKEPQDLPSTELDQLLVRLRVEEDQSWEQIQVALAARGVHHTTQELSDLFEDSFERCYRERSSSKRLKRYEMDRRLSRVAKELEENAFESDTGDVNYRAMNLWLNIQDKLIDIHGLSRRKPASISQSQNTVTGVVTGADWLGEIRKRLGGSPVVVATTNDGGENG
jgi:hypothetical protein